MALNIKNREVEELVEEVAKLAGESKTEAVRTALFERRERLRLIHSGARGPDHFDEYLKTDLWPRLPPGVLGTRLTKEEEEDILGIGPEGV